MIKVFHIITHFDLGGAERVALNIAKSSNTNFEYHIVEVVKSHSSFSKEMKEEMVNNKIKYHCSPCGNSKIAIVLFPFWFLFLYKKERPSVIHTHTEIPDLSIYLFFKMWGWILKPFKIVRTIHNNKLWSHWEKIGERVEKFFLKHQSNIAISKSTQQSYKELYGFEPNIIYNGLEIVEQKPFYGIIKDKINILYAARLEYQKGPDILAKIICSLKNNSKIHFHIIGDGSKKNSLLNEIKQCDNYTYYNKVYALSTFLSSFDYLISPSLFEGLALLPIEASLAKLPSIINDCPGLSDTLPSSWPLKVKDNNIDDYVEIISKLEPKDFRLGQIAYNYATDFFSISHMQNQYENKYIS